MQLSVAKTCPLQRSVRCKKCPLYGGVNVIDGILETLCEEKRLVKRMLEYGEKAIKVCSATLEVEKREHSLLKIKFSTSFFSFDHVI